MADRRLRFHKLVRISTRDYMPRCHLSDIAVFSDIADAASSLLDMPITAVYLYIIAVSKFIKTTRNG